MNLAYFYPAVTLTRILLFTLLSTGVTSIPTYGADTKAGINVKCAPTKELSVRIEQQTRQLQDTRDRLKAFVSGRRLVDVPPSALFTVDFDDSEAVAKRLKELIAHIQDPEAALSDEVRSSIACVRSEKNLEPLVRDLLNTKVSVDRLRLEFLSLPEKQRSALVDAQSTAQQQVEAASKLEDKLRSAEQDKNAALQSIELAEERAKTASTSDLRELATQRALLEKKREEIASLQLQLTTDLKKRTKNYQDTAEKLSEIAALLTRSGTQKEIQSGYQKVVNLWRTLVDSTFKIVATQEFYAPVSETPVAISALIERLAGDSQLREYKEAVNDVNETRERYFELRTKYLDDEKETLYRLLLQAGRLRSALLELNLSLGDESPLELTTEYLDDLSREIQIVPYRGLAFFYTKLGDFRQKASIGFIGILDIVKQLTIFIFIIGIPFFTYYALRRLENYLDRLRSLLIRRQLAYPQLPQRAAKVTAIWIRRINPYLPWLLMLLAIAVADRLLVATDFFELSEILPYISFYIWYRIFVLLAESGVGLIAYSGSMKELRLQHDRLHQTIRHIGIFFFTAFAIMHAAQDVVGKALIYRIVYSTMWFLGVLVSAYAARQWRKEIVAAFDKIWSGRIADKIKSACQDWRSWIACLPTLFIVIGAILYQRLAVRAQELEFFKLIGVELFRRKIESAANKNGQQAGKEKSNKLSDEYLRWFDLDAPSDPTILITPTNGVVSKIEAIINRWDADPALGSTLALFGEKGSGKSSLLKVIEQNFTQYHLIKLVIPPKLTTRESVYTFFGQQLGIDLIGGLEALSKFDNGLKKKTIILIDESHNLFLGTLGGFEGYRAFVDIINVHTSNIFWCATFNQRSWSYLGGVFGETRRFRHGINVSPFTDMDVKNLIMTRHSQTSYSLVYDAIIRAAHGPTDYSGISEVETQFFRLLWGQSKGNPRASMLLWLSALRSEGKRKIKVSIPHYKPLQNTDKFSDDAFFVYASIIRHENLTKQEVATVTNLSEVAVWDALRVGIDAGLMVCSPEGRYRAAPTTQFSLIQLLERKNFIYE